MSERRKRRSHISAGTTVQNEHPPDLCRWLALSKSFKILETPRTNILKEMAKYIKKKGAGPHILTAFESLRLVLEGRGHATARQAAASALRELFKRDSERVVSGEQWRSLSHKCVDSLSGEKAKGIKGEAMKLAASLIASELPAPPLAIDDRPRPLGRAGRLPPPDLQVGPPEGDR